MDLQASECSYFIDSQSNSAIQLLGIENSAGTDMRYIISGIGTHPLRRIINCPATNRAILEARSDIEFNLVGHRLFHPGRCKIIV
jgi:hypothetical protein